ncbi:MAG: prepilin-type N-terminal cleavage/methylation domain-containing protein, partial [Planctomycetota bacterium JB042]
MSNRQPRTARSAAPLERAGAGFTLLELLTVLTLISVLMGIGVGAFKKISLGRRLAVAQVKDALRGARLFAIEQSSTARVDLDPESNVIQASGFQSIGNWHLEDERSVGWPTLAETRGAATLIDDGAIGSAMLLPGDQSGWLDLGSSPSFDAEQGILVELLVRVPNDFRSEEH